MSQIITLLMLKLLNSIWDKKEAETSKLKVSASFIINPRDLLCEYPISVTFTVSSA